MQNLFSVDVDLSLMFKFVTATTTATILDVDFWLMLIHHLSFFDVNLQSQNFVKAGPKTWSKMNQKWAKKGQKNHGLKIDSTVQNVN